MKVLIVDDHALFRSGLALALKEFYDDVTVVEAGNAEEALALATSESPPNLVISDIRMPGMSGVEGLHTLLDRIPGIPVVVVSASEDPAEIRAAIAAGAKGYILKSSSKKVLQFALALVLSGEMYVPMPECAIAPAEEAPCAPRTWSREEIPKENPLSLLTPRQYDVLMLLLLGQSNKEIARNLGLLEGTVKVHIRGIMRKLNVNNRTQVAVAAAQIGLVPAKPKDSKAAAGAA